MKTLKYLFSISFAAIFSASFAFADASDEVKTSGGAIKGTRDNGISIFLGIPYAAPPVGQLRWKAPRQAAPWTGTKQADAFGPVCPQPGQKGGRISEDCLYLNVWSPAADRNAKLPVMVWIHGGGFNFGSASLPEYNGYNLAKKGVVVVTLNYRLGPLGFLAHPLLDKESELGTSGNYGILDQIAALQWVRSNIAAFGGDPERITIFGQSAGSRSVSLLLISPMAKGLFHGAIAESGGPIIGSEFLNPNFNGDKNAVAAMGIKLGDRLGATSGDILAGMRAKSADEVLEAAASATDIFSEGGLFFAPVFDGRVLPGNPFTAFTEGAQLDVPLIAGSTLNEGNIYLSSAKDLTTEKYTRFLTSRFGKSSGKALEMFPAKSDKDVHDAIDRLITVGANAQPARFMATSMDRKKSKAYLFQFTRRPATERAKNIGVHHGVELAYIFGNMTKNQGYSDTDFELSGTMMDYWVNFARTGNPNGANLPAWPEYRKETDLNMEFGDKIRVNKGLFEKECDFIGRNSQYSKPKQNRI